jgi:hypothetical protein
MFAARDKTRLPAADEALPGRPVTVPVPEKHFVNGHPLKPPFPDGLQQAMRQGNVLGTQNRQQYLARNPGGYCGIGGTGISCPAAPAR